MEWSKNSWNEFCTETSLFTLNPFCPTEPRFWVHHIVKQLLLQQQLSYQPMKLINAPKGRHYKLILKFFVWTQVTIKFLPDSYLVGLNQFDSLPSPESKQECVHWVVRWVGSYLRSHGSGKVNVNLKFNTLRESES